MSNTFAQHTFDCTPELLDLYCAKVWERKRHAYTKVLNFSHLRHHLSHEMHSADADDLAKMFEIDILLRIKNEKF
jgi:hypothetical protein